MKLNIELYSQLIEQAKQNPRLRQAMDLRNSSADNSQRMLNVLIPGTKVPIHRHPTTSETAIVLYGCIDEIYYDNDENVIGRYTLRVGEGLQISIGQFHTVEVKEPSILLEIKEKI